MDKSQHSATSKESSKKMHGHGGPVMVKNAFPEDFAFPSPAQSAMSRRTAKGKEERDLLDDFVVGDKLKQQAPAWKSKRQTINEMEAVSTQQAAFKANVERSANTQQQPPMERTAQAAIPSMLDEP